MELENKNKEKFTLTEEQFIELQAATIMLEESFTEFSGTPEQFVDKANTLVPTPRRFNRTVESTTLGNAVFVGIGKYGIDFIEKLLLTETAKYQINALFDYTMNLIDVLNNMESSK